MVSRMARASHLAPSHLAPSRPALFALHGHGFSLLVAPPALRDAALALLVDHAENELPFPPAAEGRVLPYDEAAVMRHVSADAVPVTEGDAAFHPMLELFRSRDGGRWWLVDERWGLCEVDLVRRRWHSYVLPEPPVDAVRLVEATVFWPLAQLLRGRGLHLIPAAAVALPRRDGGNRGVVILAPGGADREVTAARDFGLRVVGQRWTALREEADGTISALGLPGRTPDAAGAAGGWADAAAGNRCPHATAELLLVADPMRRAQAGSVRAPAGEATDLVRAAWPMPAIGPAGGANPLPARLARACQVHRVHLGRDGGELCRLLVGDRPAAADPARRAA